LFIQIQAAVTRQTAQRRRESCILCDAWNSTESPGQRPNQGGGTT
jgi:hypothetical protein